MWEPEHRLAGVAAAFAIRATRLFRMDVYLASDPGSPARRTAPRCEPARGPERDPLFTGDGLPMASLAERPSAEEHGASLFHAVGLGRHAGAHAQTLYVAIREAAGREASPTAGSPSTRRAMTRVRRSPERKPSHPCLLGVSVLPANIQDRARRRRPVARGAAAFSIRRANLRRRLISRAENGESRGRGRTMEDGSVRNFVCGAGLTITP
jgi:hypothetical protein